MWRLQQFRDLPEQVLAATAPHSLKSLSAAAGGVTVEWPAGVAGDPFANINTPVELAAAEARAATQMKGF
jgi:molybdopterin-guanine dinucleotide biosynthesis protein A